MHKSNEKGEVVRPHTVQDYVIKPPSWSSKKSDKISKWKPTDGSGRYLKSSKTRMTTDLVNLINKTKKDVENLRAFRRNSKTGMKSNSKKSSAVSPLGEKLKDDVYGMNGQNKLTLSHNKSDKLKVAKKRIDNGSQSNRKVKLKSTTTNFHPPSGIIDLVSRNERWTSQISNEENIGAHSINSRKSSHKHTNSIESSDRSDNKSKQRFLVSKKYNKKMVPAKLTLSKDAMKSWLGTSLKLGTSTSITKPSKNQTNTFDAYTPSSSTSAKINIKGSLLAKKWLGIAKKRIESNNAESKCKEVRKEKVLKNFKIYKESSESKETEQNSKSPHTKSSNYTYSSDKPSWLKLRGSQINGHSISTSKRIENQIVHSDLYNQIIKSRKEK